MPQKTRNSDFVLISIALFLAGVVTGAYLVGIYLPGNLIAAAQMTPVNLTGMKTVVLYIPAVDGSGNGILGTLITEVRPGTGAVLVNIKDIVTLGDTQQSAVDAVLAAAKYTHMDLSNIDVIFSIQVNASEIEGPSAGASMAASVVYALLDQTPRDDVVMTGTIDSSGNIGSVGGILEKARASKEAGATIFVVPDGQSIDQQTVPSRQCRNLRGRQLCRILYVNQDIDVSSQVNITVLEAGNLAEAVKIYQPN